MEKPNPRRLPSNLLGIQGHARKDDLRALVQDSVLSFVTMRRDVAMTKLRAEHPGLPPATLAQMLDDIQPVYEEFDPVVELAIMAADHRNEIGMRRQAATEAAKYLRPQLKAIEVDFSPLTPEAEAERQMLSARIAEVLGRVADDKAGVVIDVEPNQPAGAEDDEPEEEDDGEEK